MLVASGMSSASGGASGREISAFTLVVTIFFSGTVLEMVLRFFCWTLCCRSWLACWPCCVPPPGRKSTCFSTTLLATTIRNMASKMPAWTMMEKVSEPPPTFFHIFTKAFCGFAGSM